MRFVVIVSLFPFFLLICNNSNAQDAKKKNKETKTISASGTKNRADSLPITSDTSNLTNTTWESYFGEPINDTIMIHYSGDSSFVQSKLTGVTWITSIYKVVHDTLTIYDIDGQRACPSEVVGQYHFAVVGDTLKLELIQDDCQGRSAVSKNVTWRRTKEAY